jgi:hypothetical protein
MQRRFKFVGPDGKFVREFAKLIFRWTIITIARSRQTADSQTAKVARAYWMNHDSPTLESRLICGPTSAVISSTLL